VIDEHALLIPSNLMATSPLMVQTMTRSIAHSYRYVSDDNV